MRKRAIVRAGSPAASQLGDRLRGCRDGEHGPPVGGRAAGGDVSHRGLAVAGRSEHRAHRSARAAQRRHRLTLIGTQEPDRTAAGRRRSVAAIEAPGRAVRRSRRRRVSSSRRRWATVDQRAGSQPDEVASGSRRTTRSDSRNWSCESGDLDGGEPTGGQTGDVFDDVVFGEPGVMSTQPGVLVDETPGDLAELEGSGVRGHASTPTAPAAAPTARAISAASVCHRPNSISGVAVWSLGGRVAREASSSARIRRAGDS